MTVEELHAEMQAGFAKIENRFKRGDAKFARFRAAIKREMREVTREVMREMKRHEDALRTHFDVMVESMQDSVKIVARSHRSPRGAAGRSRQTHHASRRHATHLS